MCDHNITYTEDDSPGEKEPFNLQLFGPMIPRFPRAISAPNHKALSVYHTTFSSNVPSILRHGFLPTEEHQHIDGLCVRRQPRPHDPMPGESLLEIEINPSAVRRYGAGASHLVIPVQVVNAGRIRVLRRREAKPVYDPRSQTIVDRDHRERLRTTPAFPAAHQYGADCPGESCDKEPLHTWRYFDDGEVTES
jgi:hypothetical protein